MKKTFLLLITLVMSVSIFAVRPVITPLSKTSQPQPYELKSVRESAETKTFSAKHNSRNQAIEAIVTDKAPFRVAMAKTPITLNVKRWSKTYNEYYKTWDIMCDLFDVNGYQFDFHIATDALEYNHEYDFGDMNMTYSVGQKNGTKILYEEASFTLFVDENGFEIFDARVLDVDGQEYLISCRQEPLPEKFVDKYYVFEGAEILDEREVAYRNTWKFIGKNDSMEVVLTSNSKDILGKHPQSDIVIKNYIAYTYVDYYVGTDDYRETEIGKVANVEVVAGPQEGDYICTADLYGYDGICYHVTFRHVAPEVKEEVNLDFTNLVINDQLWAAFDVMSYTGHTDEYNVEILLYSKGEAGVYSVEDGDIANVYISDRRKDKEITLYRYGDVTMTGSEKSTKLTCDALSSSGTLYHITLRYEKPTQTRQVTIDASKTRIKDYTADPEMRCFQLLGYTEDRSCLASFTVYTNTISGTYTEKDMMTFYTFVCDNPDEESALRYEMVEANLTINYNAQTKKAIATGTMLCTNSQTVKDVPFFTINMTCVLDEGLKYDSDHTPYNGAFTADDITINLDNLASEYLISVDGVNAANEAIFLDFHVTGKDPDILIPEGTYAINDSEKPFTLFASSGIGENNQISYSFVGTIAEDGTSLTSPLWFLREGSAIVKKVNGKLRIDISAKNSYDQEITIAIGEGVPYDTKHLKASSRKLSYNVSNTTWTCAMESQDGNYSFNFDIKSEEIANGKTYTLNDMNSATTKGKNLRTSEDISFKSVQFTRTVATSGLETIVAEMTGNDDTPYCITYKAFTPTREANITITDATIDNLIVENGVYQVMGETADKAWAFSCTLYAYAIAGTFSQNNMFADYTYVVSNPSDLQSSVRYNLVQANVSVTEDKTNHKGHLTGTMVCRNEKDSADLPMFNLDVTFDIPVQKCLNYDADESNPFEGTFKAEDIVWHKEYLQSDGTIYLEVHNSERQMLYIAFQVSGVDKDIVLPAGKYVIVGNGNPFTVVPSTGATMSSITASFAGQMNEMGQMNVPAWFMRGGTITVSQENGRNATITVDATNSCGATIKATIQGKINTGLNNIMNDSVSTQKIIRDNQVIIIRDGKEYNVLGIEIR